MRSLAGFSAVVFAVALPACESPPRKSMAPVGSAPAAPAALAPAAPSATSEPAPPPSERVEVNRLDPSENPPVFVLRGARGPGRMVFLHGLCGHGQGYAQSFQYTASDHGLLVAPQGDVLCGAGPWSTWSGDISKLDGRICRAFDALGRGGSEEIALIGYSLGATLALRMARRWPERYTRLVLIAAPEAPTGAGLKGVRSTVMMAGELDRKDLMRKGAAAMRAAGIPSTFMVLPGARHGDMGAEAERVMGEALDWLFEHDRDGGR